MSEMRDRIASIITKHHNDTEMLDDTRAKLILEAMSKPTKAMIKAGWQDGNAGYGEGEEMEPIWRAMIKAALK